MPLNINVSNLEEEEETITDRFSQGTIHQSLINCSKRYLRGPANFRSRWQLRSHQSDNFANSLSMRGPPTFDEDHRVCMVGGPVDHLLIGREADHKPRASERDSY